MAHKKGAGSTRNGRDSNSQRRGIKVYGGQEVVAGNIIVRQVGATLAPGKNVGVGRDFTLFALIDGVVTFEWKTNTKKQVSVYPVAAAAAAELPGVRSHRPCRLFAVDLDGTLLDPQGRPHAVDVQALQALQAKGVAVTFSTGRLYGGVISAAQAVGLQGPVACADGSHIVEVETGRELSHNGIHRPTLDGLRKAMLRNGVAGFLLERDRVVHDDHGLPFLGYLRVWSERFHHHHEHVAEAHQWGQDVTLVVGVGDEAQVKPLHGEIADDHGHSVHSWSFPFWSPIDGKSHWGLVVRAHGTDKGTAIQWLAEHHGCSVDEVVVVGDWVNDLPMFRVAGRSFAMAQAPDAVKAAATDVLTHSGATGGGIAEAARRAGLLP